VERIKERKFEVDFLNIVKFGKCGWIVNDVWSAQLFYELLSYLVAYRAAHVSLNQLDCFIGTKKFWFELTHEVLHKIVSFLTLREFADRKSMRGNQCNTSAVVSLDFFDKTFDLVVRVSLSIFC